MSRYAKYRGLPVLVTGHTGFKGAWLGSILDRLGADWSGYALPPASDSLYQNLSLSPPECLDDIRDFSKVLAFLEARRPRLIFHLAAQSLVSVGYQEPRRTFSTNIMGLVNLMEAAVQTGVKAVVVVSSDKCYAPAAAPRHVNSRLGGADPYSASKAAAELVLGPYRDKLNISIARAGNAIGGGDWAEDRLLPDLMRALASDTSLVVRNPRASRPWQHVCELIHAYLQLGLHAMDGRHCRAWNLGPGQSATVEELMSEVAEIGLRPKIVYQKSTFAETQALLLDVQETKDVLGWESQLSWREALAWTLEEYAMSHSSSFSSLIWERFCSLSPEGSSASSG